VSRARGVSRGTRPTWTHNWGGASLNANDFIAITVAEAQDWQGSAGFRSATLLRAIGVIVVCPSQNVTAQASHHPWYLGMFNQGEPVPPPQSAASYTEENILQFGTFTSTGGAGWESAPGRDEYDTKVKRKMDTNSVLVLALGNSGFSSVATGSVDWIVSLRTLIRGT